MWGRNAWAGGSSALTGSPLSIESASPSLVSPIRGGTPSRCSTVASCVAIFVTPFDRTDALWNAASHLLRIYASYETFQVASVAGKRRERTDLEAIGGRSEEHTSELQSLMRISYAVFC